MQDSDNAHAVRLRGTSSDFHTALAASATTAFLHILWLVDAFRNVDCGLLVSGPGLHLR